MDVHDFGKKYKNLMNGILLKSQNRDGDRYINKYHKLFVKEISNKSSKMFVITNDTFNARLAQ